VTKVEIVVGLYDHLRRSRMQRSKRSLRLIVVVVNIAKGSISDLNDA
jgi:hypothetical protein